MSTTATTPEDDHEEFSDAVRATVQAYRSSIDSMMMKARLATTILNQQTHYLK